MQTPKAKTSSVGGGPQRTSPLSTSSEVSQKIWSPKGASPEASQKTSSRVARQLKATVTARYSDHTLSSSNFAGRASKDRNLKVSELKSPHSPVSESKHPGKLSDVELLVSKLENDLNTVKDQLCSTEALKKQARRDAEESNEHLLVVSLKLEESNEQLLEQSASEEVEKIVLREALEGRNQALRCDLEAIQKQHSQDLYTLFSALNEIQQLKVALESAAKQMEHSESARNDLHLLREDLREALLLVDDMKNQLRDAKESEAQAQEFAGNTLIQLETAKKMAETLRLDGFKTKEMYDATASELDLSRARVKELEELVNKLRTDISSKGECLKREGELVVIDAEANSVKVEVEQLKVALEAAEVRCNEVQVRSNAQIKSSNEMMERMKSSLSKREAELEMELRKSRYEIEELKANLMDKETELQGICEENEGLAIKLENTLSGQKDVELEKELRALKACFMDKEIEYQNLVEENEELKMEIRKMNNGGVIGEIVSDREIVKNNEREEMDKSNRKAARVTEQLEVAQAAKAEMETELRRIKVQSEQWRKAAEAAAAMLSTESNGQFMGSPYAADLDDELLKKNNANLMKRLGVLWKKQQHK